MRIEQIEDEGETQKKRSARLEDVAEEHRHQVEMHQTLRSQLDRLMAEMGSPELDEAASGLSRSEENLRIEDERLLEERQALLVENSKLSQRVDQALGKAKKGSNFLVEGIKHEFKQIGKGILQEPFKIFSDMGLIPEPGAGTDSLDRVAQATERHVARLETAKKQLLEARQLLDRVSG